VIENTQNSERKYRNEFSAEEIKFWKFAKILKYIEVIKRMSLVLEDYCNNYITNDTNK
jgi:hypothetical protein